MKLPLLKRIFLVFLVEAFPSSLANPTPHEKSALAFSDSSIEHLIADLANDCFAIREGAARALEERVEAIPALRKARHSAELEVRRRVEDILSVLERKIASRCLTKVKALGQAGRVVEVADRLAFAAKWGVAGERGWESLMLLADRASEGTKSYFPGGLRYNNTFPAGDFRKYMDCIHPREISGRIIDIDMGDEPFPNAKERAGIKLFWETQGSLLLRGEEVSFLSRNPSFGLRHGMIACSGDLQLTSARCSVIVAGGDVKKVKVLVGCILICDGDVELRSLPAQENIIIARGNVSCTAGKLRCMVRSGHTLQFFQSTRQVKIDLKDGTPDPLAFVKFFELADVGIAAEDLPSRNKSDTKGVRLKDVRKESPFSALLRAGDLITAVEEKKTPTTEIFRRVLRRRVAEGGPLITFTVQRSGKTLDVSIPVKD